MLKSLFIALLFLGGIQEETKYSLVTTIDTPAPFFTTDNLGNIYTVEKDVLKKYYPSGQLQYEYSNKYLGEITHFDAYNSLRLIAFYRDLNQVAVLDNTLSIQGEPIALEAFDFELSTLICSSNNNNLWLYNRQGFELVRVDKSFNAFEQTGNLSQILNIDLRPNFLLEHNNWVYLNNPETGILVFDIYGTYLKTIPIKGLQSFQIMDQHLFYSGNGKFMHYNMKTFTESEIELPVKEFDGVRVEKDRIFIRSKSGISIYAY